MANNSRFKFRAWSSRDGGVMLKVGDSFGTSTNLDCCQYVNQGQSVQLLQYTGLHDRTGEEVYEGDILSDSTGRTGAVLWWDGNAEFVLHFMAKIDEEDAWNGDVGMPGVGSWDSLVIVGNIYETPELMEEG